MNKNTIRWLPLLCLVFGSTSYAVILPSTVDPSRAGQEMRTRTEGTEMPSTAPSVQPPKRELSPLGAQAEKIHFRLTRIILSGNTIYSEQDLRHIYQDKLNKQISVAELYNIVEAITAYYRNNGYILTRALLPPQKVQGGVVRVRILEGYIDKVTVVGEPRGARSIVQAYGNHITEVRPVTISVMERYLRLANQLPGVTAKAILEPSQTSTGAAQMDLSTQTKIYNAYASYDNYGTLYEGPKEYLAGIELDSIFRAGDATRFSGVTTTNSKELLYGEIAHGTPIGTQGARFTVDGNLTETQPGFVLQSSEIVGRAKNAYGIASVPIIVSRVQNFSMYGGLYYLDNDVSILTLPFYQDHLRPFRIGAKYDSSDRFYGNNLLHLEYSKGLNILGATTPGATVNVSRAGGNSDFSKFIGDATRVQQIYSRFTGFLLVQGQYAFDQLLASEQFGFGGPQVGRAYDPSELIGDRGLSGSAELRCDFYPGFRFLNGAQMYIYYDAGVIWNINKAIQVGKDSATSTGGGFRVVFNNYFTGNIMLTKPLTHVVAALDIAQNGKAPRLFFNITASI